MKKLSDYLAESVKEFSYMILKTWAQQQKQCSKKIL